MLSKKAKLTLAFVGGAACIIGYQILKLKYFNSYLSSMEADTMMLIEERRKKEEMKE